MSIEASSSSSSLEWVYLYRSEEEMNRAASEEAKAKWKPPMHLHMLASLLFELPRSVSFDRVLSIIAANDPSARKFVVEMSQLLRYFVSDNDRFGHESSDEGERSSSSSSSSSSSDDDDNDGAVVARKKVTWRQLCILDWHRQTHPMLDGSEAQLDRLPELLAAAGAGRYFASYLRFECAFIDAVARRGIFPMGSWVFHRPFMLPKLHSQRCVLDLARSLHTRRTTRRLARHYRLSVNADWDGVVAGIHAQHGVNWVFPELAAAFKRMAVPGGEYATRLYSIELRCIDTGALVAGELGYQVGANYTSLSGFALKERECSGAGTVQLSALGALLRRSGFRMWDFGMVFAYKFALGAGVMERDNFRRLYASFASVADVELSPASTWNCRDLLSNQV
jgi:Leu/Phe-tRNA-protein transferase